MSQNKLIGLLLIFVSLACIVAVIVGGMTAQDGFGPLQILATTLGVFSAAGGAAFLLNLIDVETAAIWILQPPPALALAISIGIFLFIGVVFFSSTGRDDTYISYWPAHTLATRGEIVNFNGDRLEQSSSLLLVVLLGAANWLTRLPIQNLGLVISVLSGAVGVAGVYFFAERMKSSAGFVAGLLTALTSYFVYWSFSGMELALTAVVALSLLAASAKFITIEKVRLSLILWVIISIICFLMARPEAPIVLFCVLIASLILLLVRHFFDRDQRDRLVIKRHLQLLLISGVILSVLFGFRLLYFNSLFPQPVTVKGGGDRLEFIKKGFAYLKKEMWRNTPLKMFSLALIGSVGFTAYKVLKGKRTDFNTQLTLLFVVAYTSFVVMVGGDWMEGARFLVPMLPAVVALVAVTMTTLLQSVLLRTGIFLMLIVVQILVFKPFVADWTMGMPLWIGFDYYNNYAMDQGASAYTWADRTNRGHIRDIPTVYYLNDIVDRLLEHEEEPVVIFTVQAGMVPYYVVLDHEDGQVQIYDMIGLANREFIQCAETHDLTDGYEMTTLEAYYQNQEVYRACGIPDPDIVFNPIFNDNTLAEVEREGFTVVYEQRGNVIYESSFFPGIPLEIDQFVAVRDDLMPLLGSDYPLYIDMQHLMPGSMSLATN